MYLTLRKYCNFGTKYSRRTWHVFLAQEVNRPAMIAITREQGYSNDEGGEKLARVSLL